MATHYHWRGHSFLRGDDGVYRCHTPELHAEFLQVAHTGRWMARVAPPWLGVGYSPVRSASGPDEALGDAAQASADLLVEKGRVMVGEMANAINRGVGNP